MRPPPAQLSCAAQLVYPRFLNLDTLEDSTKGLTRRNVEKVERRCGAKKLRSSRCGSRKCAYSFQTTGDSSEFNGVQSLRRRHVPCAALAAHARRSQVLLLSLVL
eukprot:scaffold6996_cov48-Phaeocystis_antarctica.AAC.1